MKQCPDCGGVGQYQTWVNGQWIAEVHEDDGIPGMYVSEACVTCQGTGKVSELIYQIWQARGGAPSTRQRGFA